MLVYRATAEQGRPLGAVLAALALLAALVVVPAVQAHAACGDASVTRQYTAGPVSGKYMGSPVTKAGVGCSDVNVRWAQQGSTKRGQFVSTVTGNWVWDSVGNVFVSAGTHSPVIELLDSIPTGYTVRIGSTVYENLGTWWY